MTKILIPKGYAQLLNDLKERIRTAQLRAVISVNRELVLLYWQIGREILKRQEEEGWGTKVIDRLAKDLRKEFPTMKGFSPRNLKYMRAFAEAWPEEQIVQQAAAQIPWFHNCVILDKLADTAERLWYIQGTIQNGWSRNVLVHQIESDLYRRKGRAVTNFEQTLPSPQSDLAQQSFKDPYIMDFLPISEELHERDLERLLIDHIREFLLELGIGFSFVGNQFHLEVGGQDYFLDLLFYHLKLRCFVVIDLKTGQFKPEYAGKMNFYLAAVDDLLTHKDDRPSIGIILCKSKNQIIVEYALRDTRKPIGVAEYRITRRIPKNFKGSLPETKDLENRLRSVHGDK